jgi:hypothetical protein
MTYIMKPSRRVAQTYRPMGDVQDTLRQAFASGGTVCDACDAAGRAAQAPFNSQMHTIATAWANRDDFYYVADIDKIIQQGFAFMNAGHKLLDQLDSAYQEAGRDDIKNAREDVRNALFDVGKTAIDFVNAVNTAKTSNIKVVDAPGLKNWVLDAVSAAGRAAYVAGYTKEAMPAYTAGILALMSVAASIGNGFVTVIKAAARVTIAAGQTIYKTTVGTLSFAATVIKYAPFIGGAALVAFLWKRYRELG